MKKVSDVAEFYGVSRSSVTRALKTMGHVLPPIDPNDPSTYNRIDDEMFEEIGKYVERKMRQNEVDIVGLADLLLISETTVRRMIRHEIITDFTEVKYPRRMYVFNPAQIEKTIKRIEVYERLKREGYRSAALIKQVQQEIEREEADNNSSDVDGASETA